MNKRAWIVADRGNSDHPHSFLYHKGKNLWGPCRDKTLIFLDKKKADDTAILMDSTAWEVSIPEPNSSDAIRPFTVIEWSK